VSTFSYHFDSDMYKATGGGHLDFVWRHLKYAYKFWIGLLLVYSNNYKHGNKINFEVMSHKTDKEQSRTNRQVAYPSGMSMQTKTSKGN